MRLCSSILFLSVFVGFIGCEQPSASNPATRSITEVNVPSRSLPSQGVEAKSKPTGLPRWSPDSAMESLLAAPEVLEGVSIRPPTGFVGIVAPGAPPGVFVKAWKGAPRQDNSSPSVQLSVLTSPATDTFTDIESVMRKTLNGIKRNRNDWTESEVSRGTIQGIEFLRATWTGEIIPAGIKMRGVIYVAMQDSKVFQVSSQDVEPFAEEALRLAESSLRTFAISL